MPQLRPNHVFANRYRLLEQIGVGGFAEVWKAADQMAEDMEVAVKIYAPEKGLDDIGIRQFRKEYALTQSLNHPNLLQANYYDIIEGSPYLIMPLIKNGSLSRMLYEQGPLNEEQLAVLLRQVAGALAYLHSRTPPIMHQDIKPENILIDADNTYRLTDFGISSQLRSTLRKSTTSQQAMTMAYAPPERFGKRPRNVCAGDVFSLGVMVYEATTGELPWMGAGGVVIRDNEQIPLLPESFSPALVNMIESTMAIDPENRPSAEDLAEAAGNYLETGKWEAQENQKDKENPQYQSGDGEKHIHKKPETKERQTEQKPAEPETKSSDGILLTSLVALFLLGVVFWQAVQNSGSNEGNESAEQAWQKAQQSGKLADYRRYVNTYSNGNHIAEAKQNIKDEKAWKIAKNSGKLSDYKEYVNTYPSGNHVTEAKKYIKDEKAWEIAQNSGKLADYREYVNTYPNGNHIAEAKQNIQDEKAWQSAQNSGKLSDYQEYVNTYPNGNHVAEAKENIRQISEGSTFRNYNNNSDRTLTTTTRIEGKLRSSDFPGSNIIKYIPKGATVRVIENKGNYWKVFYDGKTGYLNEMYLNITNNMSLMKK